MVRCSCWAFFLAWASVRPSSARWPLHLAGWLVAPAFAHCTSVSAEVGCNGRDGSSRRTDASSPPPLAARSTPGQEIQTPLLLDQADWATPPVARRSTWAALLGLDGDATPLFPLSWLV